MPFPDNCNPACVKIILNGGLIAIETELLMDAIDERYDAELRVDASLAKAARQLIDAAHALDKTYAYLVGSGIGHKVRAADWHGCEHAETLMSWVRAIIGGSDVDQHEIAATMTEWRDQIYGQIANMVSTKA